MKNTKVEYSNNVCVLLTTIINKCVLKILENEERSLWQEWLKEALYLFVVKKLIGTDPNEAGEADFEGVGTGVDEEKLKSDVGHILVGHEFGHNLGLQHKGDAEDNLMLPAINSNNVKLDEDQISIVKEKGGKYR